MMKKSIDSSSSTKSGITQYEEYLESIVDTIREALLVLDKDLRVISANTTFYDRFRVTPKQTEGKLVYELGSGQWNIPELKKLLEVILPTHNPFNGFRVEHDFPRIGKMVMLLNARQIKAKGKWKDRVLLAIEDITEYDKFRIEKEAGIKREQGIASALKESQAESELRRRLYEAVTDSTLDLIYVFDLNYRFTYANKALLEMWGTTDYVGKSLVELGYEPWHAEMHEREIDRVIATKKPIRGDVPFTHATLGKRTYDYIFVPVFNSKKDVIAVAGTTRDITELRNLTQQKDDFIGIASHELKTPVTSIKAYGQVLQTMFKRRGEAKAVEALQKLDAQVNKLTNLIGDLLDVTKIQSGRIEFHEDYFDFNKLVNEIVDEMQLTTEFHTLKKKLGKTIRVFGDRDRIGQVITNLISNAIKYSPHTNEIHIVTTSENQKVTLGVQDFGVGIPKDKQEKIFEQFFRVSGPNHSTVPGLGLGLYISSEIIKRQGGRIWVESVEGKGSNFCFSLPVHHKKIKQKNKLVNLDIQHE
jgi:PAS domain S-box-containing protein